MNETEIAELKEKLLLAERLLLQTKDEIARECANAIANIERIQLEFQKVMEIVKGEKK